ncbi:peptide-methionine (S)-S-oxide reductase MsrA [Nitratidesulfovibrio sp. SRB-5]|uniref:peptide-methionine (S)-S-oxide reductase MsrA n=1 Tax=Nitratidesulfovibrio sp. SRB-5 TaxID=2872636 RepID=UPI0010253F8F|nr:peptide-methionine (S)-S-oxide reductase MsrA [Nitratidesulfovibrio sp. SRB-5]MBZ2171230.1 peptide-methionine (S)-S-oxide reductase MsrA [Nitratidesulfovibrio sp. SRB-5]RXF76688.1 peptide-methionine (S)-S-oxide reductase [Desulfovibrio sp. DS-1]
MSTLLQSPFIETATSALAALAHLLPLSALLLAALLLPATARAAQDDAVAPPRQAAATATAVFAGGCFWCMEKPFDQLDGVLETTSGYTGGNVDSPTYKQVSSGLTGHAEALRVTYDPARVTYETLLDVFWRNVDPLDAGGQFCDRGSQYRSAIFVADAAQREVAEASKKATEARLGKPVATGIEDASTFWPAEEYHQDYYRKNPIRYAYYRTGCGRDKRLEQVWGAEK